MKSELQMTMDAAQPARKAVCPACGGEKLGRFFEIPELPTNCVALGTSRDSAIGCAKGRIDLGFCRSCGAVNNLAYDAAKLSYDASYDNSLHFSPTFQKYANEVARDLVNRLGVRGKNVIDVGCGNGEFLSLICEVGDNRGMGFDPSFIPGRANLQAGQGVTIIPDYYSAKYSQHAADFVMCRHVLEHIPEPQTFLRNLRTALSNKPDAAIFFELPNAEFVFQKSGLWDIIYEHCFYYSPGAMARLFASCGFDVVRVYDAFRGQYLCLEARVSAKIPGQLGSFGGDLTTMHQGILKFSEEYRETWRRWRETLSKFAAAGKRVVLWGAGAKGAMFLNAFRDVGSLEYIVDVNPHKHGLFVPGTGQEVVSPEFLKGYRPDVLLIVNANYREEIARKVSELGLTPEILAI